MCRLRPKETLYRSFHIHFLVAIPWAAPLSDIFMLFWTIKSREFQRWFLRKSIELSLRNTLRAGQAASFVGRCGIRWTVEDSSKKGTLFNSVPGPREAAIPPLTHSRKTGREDPHAVFQSRPHIHVYQTPGWIVVVHACKFTDSNDGDGTDTIRYLAVMAKK